MLSTLTRLASICDQHGILYMLYGGALLGSYRLHGVVPWDDDVDLLVALADRSRLQVSVMCSLQLLFSSSSCSQLSVDQISGHS